MSIFCLKNYLHKILYTPPAPEFLSELQRSVLSLSFDQQALTDLTEESLDLEKIETVFKNRGKQVSLNKLQSLGILVPHARRLVPTIGGLILFGKMFELERFLPDARVSCARFLGDNKATILDRFTVEGTILEAIDSKV